VIVVGIDVSLTKTGVAIVDTETRTVTAGRVVSASLGEGVVPMRNRIRKAVDGVLGWMPHAIDLVVLERPLPARGGFASLQLERAAAYWFLVDQLVPRCGGAIADVHPSTRAMLATGNGHAKEAEVLARIRSDFPDLVVADDNVADAVALAAGGAAWLGTRLIEYSPKQETAHGNVSWPSISKGRNHGDSVFSGSAV
jgi:Holliday junction resolvasome RuvABC endonuclease subunit